MASHSLGLSLHEAARRMGVPFVEENEPADRFVDANGLRFHYLEWGNPASPTVLMLHGVSQQAHSWDFISLPLSADYHVISPWTSGGTATATGRPMEITRWTRWWGTWTPSCRHWRWTAANST